MRWNTDEIAAANCLASARNEKLTAIATGGTGFNLINPSEGIGEGANQKTRVVHAKLVASPDRSTSIYAIDGTLAAPALKIV